MCVRVRKQQYLRFLIQSDGYFTVGFVRLQFSSGFNLFTHIVYTSHFTVTTLRTPSKKSFPWHTQLVLHAIRILELYFALVEGAVKSSLNVTTITTRRTTIKITLVGLKPAANYQTRPARHLSATCACQSRVELLNPLEQLQLTVQTDIQGSSCCSF